MQVAAVCTKVGTPNLEFDCPMVQLKACWDDKPERFYIDCWVYECIIALALLVCAIHHLLVSCVVLLLFLWEFMEGVGNSNVL